MKTKTLLTSLLSLMIIFSSCSDVDSDSISEIKLNETSLEIYKWDEATFISSTLDGKTADKNVTWISSDPSIVSVNENGKIKALKKGTASITAKNEKYFATCDITVNPNVYVVGHSTANSYGIQMDSTFGKVWKNGEEITLPSGAPHTHPQSIYVSNGDVYIVGYEISTWSRNIVFWKNNEVLRRIKATGYVNSVYVDGEDVYVVGYTMDKGSNDWKAKLWKNDEEIELPCTVKASYARSVYAHNGDVYVVGYTYDGKNAVAKLWKNNEEITLPTQSFSNGGYINSIASAVLVSNGDLYVIGNVTSTHLGQAAVAWKNGEEIILKSSFDYDRMSVMSGYVANGDIYAVGYKHENTTIPVLWKNGEEIILPSDSRATTAESVFVSGEDVYVAGSENQNAESVAKFWKNGKVTNLTDKDKIKHGFAYSVFVEE